MENDKRVEGRKGYFNNIERELRLNDRNAYKEILRMNHDSFY